MKLMRQIKLPSFFFKQETKMFAIHGGGNIGLGLMADIVSRSDQYYKIIATSSNALQNSIINLKNKLWFYEGNDKHLKCIENISMLDARKSKNITYLYQNADILALALTEAGFINSISTITEALILRAKSTSKPLQILILMNKAKAHDFVLNKINSELKKRISSEKDLDKILSLYEFIPTVVDRIATKINRETVLKSIQDFIINKTMIFKLNDKNSTMENIKSGNLTRYPELSELKLPLFQVEQNYNMYVPESFQESSHFPGIAIVKDIDVFMEIKNKFINGPHAILAWVGALMNFSTVSSAVENPILKRYIINLMERELYPILLEIYPTISRRQLDHLKKAFIKRCQVNESDTVKRVGRDPLRKLNKDSCVRGILTLKNRYKLKHATPHIELGIAAGILYASSHFDDRNLDCRKICELQETYKSYDGILTYNGPCSTGTFLGLHEKNDRETIKNITLDIKLLKHIISFAPSKRLELLNQLLDDRVSEKFVPNYLTAWTGPSKPVNKILN